MPMKRFVVLLFLLTGCGVTGAVRTAPPPDGSFNDTDVMFVQMAVSQHEQGIAMAALGAERASRKEIRDLAAAIQVTQEDELTQLEEWLTDWNQPVAADPDPTAHAGHGGMHGTDPVVLQVLQATPPGQEFDGQFLNLLTAHQHGAVELARMAEKDGRNPDVRALADRIIRSRTAQIQQMATYL
jgi:uncharacterized protein (DUF305 family)